MARPRWFARPPRGSSADPPPGGRAKPADLERVVSACRVSEGSNLGRRKVGARETIHQGQATKVVMPDSPHAISGGGILSANSLFPGGARFRQSPARAAHNLNQGDVNVTRGIFAWLLVLMLCVGGVLPGDVGAVLAQSGAPAASPDYTVGARDILVISVWKQGDLSGKFEVGEDGAIAFPLLGRVPVAGQKLPAIEKTLTDKLAGGFLRNPQVAVAVELFRSQQVFVLGEVKAPGAVPLTGGMTVIEALVRAGSYSDSLGGEVIVSRMPDGASGRPVLPGAEGAVEVQRFDLRELRTGRAIRNVPLQDGDTVFVTRAEVVFIEGQVANPGVYVFEKKMTILRLVSLAGGATAVGAQNRPRIKRIVDGKIVEIKAKLSDELQPGDTVVIPTRLI